MGKTNWTDSQLMAIKKRNSNILVSASAGSGKTAVLVERIIQKVVNEYLDVDKILVVTFTNAAAQELKEKILNAIYKALEDESDIKKKNHLKNQLVYINRANITTIDAFCLRIVKENFNVLEIDPNIRICDESQSVLLKSKILEELLDTRYETYADDKNVFGLYNVLELFNAKEEEFLETVLRIYNYIQSFSYPFEWLKDEIEKYNIDESLDLYDTDFGKDIYDDAISELNLCVLKYEEWLRKISQNEEFNKCFMILDEDLSAIKKCIRLSDGSWDRLYENLQDITFSKFNIGKVSNEELKVQIADFRKKESKDVIEKLKSSIYAKSEEILKDNKIAYKYMTYLYDFILKFDELFKEEKKKIGVAEFNDIMHYALELLVDKDGNITDVAKNLKQRYKEIYTDEYQDTSYVQERILSAISKENNRFMVGDIKQSIYGFRGARPDIFNEKYIQYNTLRKSDNEEDELNSEDACKIILSQNFRSREQVISSINYIFEKIMSMKNGQCNYALDEALKCGNNDYIEDEDTNYTTQINIINLKEDKESEFQNKDLEDSVVDEDLKSIEIEAKCIAYKIGQIIKNDKVMTKNGTLRKATYSDIVILLRGVKNRADVIEKELKQNFIPVFCDTSSSIFEGDEVKLVLSFLKVLDNPYQDVNIVSVMYSIIGGFSLDEITKIRLYDSNSYVYTTLENIVEDKTFEDDKLLKKIEDFLSIIKKYIKYSKIFSISDLLIMLYKDTNIYYQFAIDENAASKKANLDYLIELASGYGTTNNSDTLSAYIRYVDSLKDKSDRSTTSAKIIGENENVVRIMTIHKSKGLEFPIVILADTARTYNAMDSKNKVVYHHKYGIGIDIVSDTLNVSYPSVIKQAIKSVTNKEAKSEELRLLYVALTRAKEKLYIFATVKDYEKDYMSQSISFKDGKFNETLIGRNNSYYKNILPVIKYYNEYEANKDVFDINVIDIKKNIEDDSLKEMFEAGNEEQINYSVEDIVKEYEKNHDDKEDTSTTEKIKELFENEYKYEEDTKTPSRISVSNLKKAKYDEEEKANNIKQVVEDEVEENKKENDDKYNAPDCILEQKQRYSAVRKGILIHFILQNLDFKSLNSKSDIAEVIEKLVLDGVVSKNDKKYINTQKIYNFLNSKIGSQLKEAKNIFREYEFILKDENISKSLIQGVIDLFYVKKDKKVVLVDFKTDKLYSDEDFIARYKLQLDIYKEAINTLTDYNVDNTYIYSFNLDKEIEL